MTQISSRQSFSKDKNKKMQIVNVGRASSKDKAELPVNYLEHGYFKDKSTTPDREYVLKYAKEIASNLATGKQAMKRTQLRGFYDKVKNAKDSYDNRYVTLDEAIFSICQLSSLAQQSVNKGNAPILFQEFIDKNIEHIKDYNSLKAFETHFRAIVCYFQGK